MYIICISLSLCSLSVYIHIYRERYKDIYVLKCIYKDEERGSVDLEQKLAMMEEKRNDQILLY